MIQNIVKKEYIIFFHRVCIHGRDWVPGAMIPDQILSSIEKSRRTIFVLSKEYCKVKIIF